MVFPDRGSYQIKKTPDNTSVYQREIIKSKERHTSLTREERVTQLKELWQTEIDLKHIDLDFILKREKAKILSYPFTSETELTSADVLAAINSFAKENGHPEVPHTEVMGLLGVSNTFDLPPAFDTLLENISAFQPSFLPDRDIDASLAWFYWQVDQVGKNLSSADLFFQMLRLVTQALYNFGDETVIEPDGNTFKVQPIIENPLLILERARTLISRYPADPDIVRRIVERNILFYESIFKSNPEHIILEIEDQLTYLHQHPLSPEPENGEFNDETMACKLEAINQLRKHFQSPVPTFSLEEKLYWMGRSAFYKADRWSPHPGMMLHTLRDSKLEPRTVLDVIEKHYDEFYDKLREAANFFEAVSDLHAWNFLSERSLLAIRNKK